jgi:low affinity Fe/Cu permease
MAEAATPRRGAIHRASERLAHWATMWTASTWGFALAVSVVVIWVVTGPLWDFSDTWQLVINTGTTIVTFLMVFLLQRAQNKDAHAIQLKLDELIAAVEGASNRLLNIEDLNEEELGRLHERYRQLAEQCRVEGLRASHSVEEELEPADGAGSAAGAGARADSRSRRKRPRRKRRPVSTQ